MQVLKHMQMIQHGDEFLHIVFAKLFQDRVDLGFYGGEFHTANLADLGSRVTAGH